MEDDDYKMRHFTYYSRIVMMIVVGIQLILFIVFIVSVHSVRSIMEKIFDHTHYSFGRLDYDFTDIYKEQTQAIDTCFAFFTISFALFLLEFIVHFACEKKYDSDDDGFVNVICFKWNHLVIILTFVIIQFLYVISCLIIPIYLDRVRTFKDMIKDNINQTDVESIDSCIYKYVALLVVSFVFLFIFLFLYFIIINLYKEVCCDMRIICDRTNRCMGSFFGCFFDNFYYFLNCCKMRESKFNDLVNKIKEKKQEIAGKTCEIQNLMKENIDLRIVNIEYL